MRKNLTKKILSSCLLILIFLSQMAYAQQTAKEDNDEPKNMVKWNFTSAFLKQYTFQYERTTGENFSLAIGFRYVPESKLLSTRDFQRAIDNVVTWNNLTKTKSSNFSITPEVRYYTNGFIPGFYIAPYFRYMRYTIDLPFEYGTYYGIPRSQLDITGNLHSFTGGLLAGIQLKLYKKLYIDWLIIGPNAGIIQGTVSGKKTLTVREQIALKRSVEDISNIQLGKVTPTVDADGVKIKVDSPWGGLRSGFSIGYRF